MSLGRVVPHKYQKEAVYFMEQHDGRVLLADATGLGKTLQALHYLRRNPQALPAIVACQASVKYHWEREASIQIGLRADVIEGRAARKGGWGHHPPLTVCNFDILPQHVPYLKRIKAKTLIIDETQNIKTPDTKRTRAVFEFTRPIPHILALSATPLTNRPAELWPTLNILWPKEFPSFVQFCLTYAKPRKKFGKWTYAGAQNMPELHARLKALGMLRRTKEEAELELPPVIRRAYSVEITNAQEYAEAKHSFRTWLHRVGGPKKALRAAYAEKVVQVGYLRRLAARGKLRAVGAWVDRFLANSEEKVILACEHRKMVRALYKHYEGITTFINGDVTGRARTAAIHQFRDDPKCRIMVGNTQAMGTGTDGLQDRCRTIAVVELPWQPGVLTQLEGRVDRIGQSGAHTWICYLIAAGTIEEHICQILQEKQEVLSAVLDGTAAPDDTAILDLLLERLAFEE